MKAGGTLSRWLAAAAIVCGAAWRLAPADAQAPNLPAAPADGRFRFVILGDNRNLDDGAAREQFLMVLDRVAAERPAFAVNTGDMISGYTEDAEVIRRQWRGYRAAIARLPAPMFHVPGNHDIFDGASAALYREALGPPTFAFDHGPARFIGLDTESEAGRLDAAQFAWLESQLAGAAGRHVFVFLHRPLFPLDAHVGSALDVDGASRDRLHALFRRHLGSIGAVFQGHEHMYDFEVRDGVPYYTTGGAGADLHISADLGGVYHYLVADVTPAGAAIELRTVDAGPRAPPPVRTPSPGVIESWERGSASYAWDATTVRRYAGRATDGRQGLELWFDFSLYAWPLAGLTLSPAADWSAVSLVRVDVHVPEPLGGRVAVQPVFHAGGRRPGPAVPLRPGWNLVSASPADAGLGEAERRRVSQVEWLLSGPAGTAGSVVFDRFRTVARPATPGGPRPETLVESWEGPLFWGGWATSSPPAATTDVRSHGDRAVRLDFDFATGARPLLYAVPSPAWSLAGSRRLAIDIHAPPDAPGPLAVDLHVIAGARRYRAPAAPLAAGWNRVRADLAAGWLPPAARARVERLEWVLTSRGGGRGWVAFDRLAVER